VAATLQWNRELESNRIKWLRLKGHLFSTILASAGFHGLWQSHLHSSLMQEGCLLFLHDQLMPDP